MACAGCQYYEATDPSSTFLAFAGFSGRAPAAEAWSACPAVSSALAPGSSVGAVPSAGWAAVGGAGVGRATIWGAGDRKRRIVSDSASCTGPQPPASAQPPTDWRDFLRRVLLVVAVVGLALGTALILWFQVHVVLLAVAGVLLAVFLYRSSACLMCWTHMPYWLSLTVTCVLLLLLAGGAAWVTQNRIAAQLDQLGEQLPRSWQQIRAWVDQQAWGRWLVERTNASTRQIASQTLVSSGLGVVSHAGGVLAEAFVVLFIGLFGAISPELYVRGAIRLVPPAQRRRAREILMASGDLLWWWMIGQVIAMAFIGMVTFLSMWLLSVPLALSLALIAAVLNFIPNFGPVLAAVPAAMLALLQGPMTAVWVLVAYILIQFLQNHLVTPLVQQKTVDLPPVILVLAQIFMYYWAGLLGTAMAPALAAVVIRVVQMLYVQDLLGDPMLQDEAFFPESDTRRSRPSKAME